MKGNRVRSWILAAFSLTTIALLSLSGTPAQEKKKLKDVTKKDIQKKDIPAATGKHAWTLKDAVEALRRRPDDGYLQYVVFQLASLAPARDKARATKELNDQFARRPRPRVDAMNLFSGAHAVQESLQLDTLLPGSGVDAPEDEDAPKDEKKDDDGKKAKKYTGSVPLAKLEGPTVKSHPWEKMLGDKKPATSVLSRSVPEDFYFVEFRSVSKLLEASEAARDWSGYVGTQGSAEAGDTRLDARLRRQLLLEVHPELRPLYDRVVGAVGMTGSDLFIREGSDVTVLFEVKSPLAFQGHTRVIFEQAKKEHPQAKEIAGEYLGVTYRGLVDANNSVRAYTADPRPDLHLRSNSLIALKQVLETVRGKKPDGTKTTSLGDSIEFRYIRTLMPLGAAEEDGVIYFSDPFIRRMVGAHVRLVERRRMIGFNHLRIITHAAQLYATQYGKRATSLRDLESVGLTPGKFNVGPLASPFGGAYSLAADGLTGVCTVLGTTEFMTPCCELPHTDATPQEAKLYDRFVEEYSRFWRNYFDPIVVRLQVTSAKLRMETLILPLIDDTIYAGLADFLGGPTVRLDALPVPKKNLFTVNVQFNKAKLLEAVKKNDILGLVDPQAPREPSDSDVARIVQLVSAIGGGLPNGMSGQMFGPQILISYQAREGRELGTKLVPYTVTKMVPVSVSLPERESASGVTAGVAGAASAPFGLATSVSCLTTLCKDVQGYVQVSETGHKPVTYRAREFEISADIPAGDPAIENDADKNEEQRLLKRLEKRFLEFFTQGLDGQIGVHFYDQRIMFDLDLERFFGELVAFDTGRGRNRDVSEVILGGGLPIAFIGGSFFSPVYMSAGLADTKACDEFLEEIDALMRKYGHYLRTREMGITIAADPHMVTTKAGNRTRALSVRIGPVRWRTYLARVGHGLYLTNQTEVIDDLHRAQAELAKQTDRGPDGHAMLRLRAANWKNALPGFQYTWEENLREACMNDLHLLAHVARAHSENVTGTVAEKSAKLIELTEKAHGVRCRCADGGTYTLEPDGVTWRCSVHGTIADPHQHEAPDERSPFARLMRDFRDATASVTFLPEGLRAVITIERKK
jgi:hypothetical protein